MARAAVRLLAVRLPTPCWLRLRRGGCGVSMGVGAPMLRELTRRGCPSGARSAQRVPRRTPQPHRRRLPRSAAQGSQTGGRLFFGDFLLAKQKRSYSHAGRLPAPAFSTGMRPIGELASKTQVSTSSTRTVWGRRRAQASTGSARTDAGGTPASTSPVRTGSAQLSPPPPPAKSPPRATPQTTPSRSTRPPPSH